MQNRLEGRKERVATTTSFKNLSLADGFSICNKVFEWEGMATVEFPSY